MPLFDSLTSSVNSAINSTINSRISNSLQEARSIVNQGVSKLVLSKLPNNNAIPGVLGNIVSETSRKVVGNGLSEVLNAINVPINSAIQNTNRNIWQQGTAAATKVYDNIRAGVSPTNIVKMASEPLSLLKYTHDAREAVANNIASQQTPVNRPYSPYAMDLFHLAPKHKFLFVCEFVFNGGFDYMGSGQNRKNEFATVISQFERPKIKYEYDDNVNYYNFRTKVVRKVIHDPLTIKFLDDRQNLSMKFFHEYMKATHPITTVAPNGAAFYEDNGMNFEDPALFSGSFTSLKDNQAQAIKEIKVFHLYDFGAKMNVYHFTNPKLLSVSLDNWSMEDSEGNTIIGEFGYDAVHIELGLTVSTDDSETISTLSDSGEYSLHPNERQ